MVLSFQFATCRSQDDELTFMDGGRSEVQACVLTKLRRSASFPFVSLRGGETCKSQRYGTKDKAAGGQDENASGNYGTGQNWKMGRTLYGVGSLLNLISRWMRNTWTKQGTTLVGMYWRFLDGTYQIFRGQFGNGAVLVDDSLRETLDKRVPVSFGSPIVYIMGWAVERSC